MIDTKSLRVLSTFYGRGATHDFKLLKQSKLLLPSRILARGDSGYQGIHTLHANSVVPIKHKRGEKLSPEEKRFNKKVSSERTPVEHVIGCLKVFKILADKYRNRRRRFALRFNLIAGFYNAQCAL